MKLEAVLFDFDYTLGDSSHGIAACMNHALAGLGLEPIGYDDACKLIGLSLPEAYRRLTGEPTGERAEKFKQIFVERADDIMVSHTTVFPTTAAVIESLRARGLRLGIVTTKYRRRIEAVLDRESMRDAFAVIVGADDVANPKPHPEALHAAVDQLGVSLDAALFVGDSVVDAEAAMRAGMSFVAVLTGTTAAADFQPFNVVAMLSSLADLPSIISATAL